MFVQNPRNVHGVLEGLSTFSQTRVGELPLTDLLRRVEQRGLSTEVVQRKCLNRYSFQPIERDVDNSDNRAEPATR